MPTADLYRDIALRTNGDVYIGVVGPVRSGKSTFIQKFMEQIVIPGVENAHLRSRMLDEIPQSGTGKTIMTTQPVFVPNEAVEVALPDSSRVKLRLIDSVGYLVDGALGTQEGDALRMVHTPWAENAIPFETAAEIGTKKVIGEHSTIGLVITTDGSVTDFPREAYIDAERRAISELKLLGKPFVVILNTSQEDSRLANSVKEAIESEHGVPVIAMNISRISESDIRRIIEHVLNQFPVQSLSIQTPEWLCALDSGHWLVRNLEESLMKSIDGDLQIGEAGAFAEKTADNPNLSSVIVKETHHGSGEICMQLFMNEGMFNQILAEQCGTEIRSDAHLLSLLRELVHAKKEYDHIESALRSVRETGYGLVPPKLDELTLQEPELIKQGGRFGVRLRASAPSLHLIRVDINTEISPVVGSEQQTEEMVRYLMEGFEQDPQKLWQSNLFGKPLSDLVREGLSSKLMHMPAEAQLKLRQTLEKIINEGSGGMLCILL